LKRNYKSIGKNLKQKKKIREYQEAFDSGQVDLWFLDEIARLQGMDIKRYVKDENKSV
jgi:hypothetical protein